MNNKLTITVLLLYSFTLIYLVFIYYVIIQIWNTIPNFRHLLTHRLISFLSLLNLFIASDRPSLFIFAVSIHQGCHSHIPSLHTPNHLFGFYFWQKTIERRIYLLGLWAVSSGVSDSNLTTRQSMMSFVLRSLTLEVKRCVLVLLFLRVLTFIFGVLMGLCLICRVLIWFVRREIRPRRTSFLRCFCVKASFLTRDWIPPSPHKHFVYALV